MIDVVVEDAKVRKTPFTREFKSFLKEVSITGIKYAVNPHASVIRKLLWCLLVLGGLFLAIYQINDQIRFFISNPATTVISIKLVEALDFPTVTVCNENIYSASKTNDLDPSGKLARLIKGVWAPFGGVDLDDVTQLDVFSEPGKNWTEYYDLMYVDINSQLLQCTFKGVACSEHMYKTVVTGMGRCLEFNPHGMLNITQIGLGSGLKLVLRNQQDDYLYTKSGSAGYKVHLHHHIDQPLMELYSSLVNVNHITNIQIYQEQFMELPMPYGDCDNTPGYLYSDCYQQCLNSYLFQQCNCTKAPYHGYPACDPYTLLTCIQDASRRFNERQILTSRCSCNMQCDSKYFPLSLSSAQVSDIYVESLRGYLQEDVGINVTTDILKKDFVELDIYYPKLTLRRIQTQSAYSGMALLCDVGGALGLILGSTLLTLVEFGDFFIAYAVNQIRRKS